MKSAFLVFLLLTLCWEIEVYSSSSLNLAINSVLSRTPPWIEKMIVETSFAERETALIYESTPMQGAIGVKLRDDGLVCEIKAGTSAERSLAIGDIILAIDGINTKDMSFSEMVELMKGPAGSTLSLEIMRSGVENLNVNVTRVAPLGELEICGADGFAEDLESSKPIQCGLGFNLNTETLRVDAVTYAAYWGLRTGDELLNIDGHKLCETRKEDLSQIVIGDEGTSADVLLKRVDQYGPYLVFVEIIRKAEDGQKRSKVGSQNSNQMSRVSSSDGMPLLSLANSVGGILSGWLGKGKK